jgi:hypothetical protein
MAKALTQKFCDIANGTPYPDEWVTSLLSCDKVFQYDSSCYNLGVLPRIYLSHTKHVAMILMAKLRRGDWT